MNHDANTETAAQGLPYEHCIAYFIVGKLILDGALDPSNLNFENGGERPEVDQDVPFIVNSIAAALMDGLRAFGWNKGGVARLIDMGDWGVMHHNDGKGGAE